ncbi:glucose-6-phosphate dehydrogenase [Parvularcula sp. LCG005]|uniref:glucose-6-phosphate dehydrogenase n=1 Tax=Parvularcula sp. LCG005 TaxID=3078805 RepID=UPI0029422204|nr:glucose-6-phosphate dehydrogenase [Parvularcula sp. LCG005]WOI53054.1 glucose-6-phosphate dehydrogenase [Parvularcula sp. LCG005]
MTQPPTFVLFGATGDLARRMLFPSLYFLHMEGFLEEGQKIIGSSRSEYPDEEFREKMRPWIKERTGEYYDEATFNTFAERVSYVAVDASEPAHFARLRDALNDGQDEAVFYLSTSPSIFSAVCDALNEHGLSKAPNRIVVEKPIGHDLQSCIEINDTLASAFSEDRTYRIDHYLGKETVQNLIALRFANRIFEPLWSASSIDNVQITISETVGAEGRGGYYDAYGAIRDMVQNHMIQLLCLMAMEPPASLSADAIRNEKVKVLRSLAPITPANVQDKTVRGQYIEGHDSDGKSCLNYLDDVEATHSDTETYVAINAEIKNWRWAGVPFYLQTGKRMSERKTEIVVSFRPLPHSIFDSPASPNELVITLQPKEEIKLQIMNKRPGLIEGSMPLQELSLNLSLSDHLSAIGENRRRIAYEQLILDALRRNASLFVQRDEQEAAWRFIDGIVDSWDKRNMTPMPYKSGRDGPPGKHSLTERNGHSWYE